MRKNVLGFSAMGVALLILPLLLASKSVTGASPEPAAVRTYIVRPAGATASDALQQTSALRAIERYCSGEHCVALPRDAAERAALAEMESAGLATIEPFPQARQIDFAKATYDVDARSFRADFPGRTEVDAFSAFGQWALVFKSFLRAEWKTDLEAEGLFLGEPLGPMAYLAYGPRDGIDTILQRATYVVSALEIPHGIKRKFIDDPLPDDETDRPAFTTVVLFNVPESPTYRLLEQSLGRTPPIVYDTGLTVAYGVVLTRSDATYLSSFPDVISIAREVSEAVPSDERSNRVVAGAYQVPGTAWPRTLPPNNAADPFWSDYLGNIRSLVRPEKQTIAFLDTGVGDRPSVSTSCPPDLVDPDTGACSLTLDGNRRSILDFLDFSGHPGEEDLKGSDFYLHGSLTTAIAAGFGRPPGAGGRDAESYTFGMGVAPGARIAMSKTMEDRTCRPKTTWPARVYPNEEGDGSLAGAALSLKYSMVVMSRPVTETSPAGEPGAAASLYNHSWNVGVFDYGSSDVLMDQSARTQAVLEFDFGAEADQHDVRTGADLPATHIVSVGNVPNDDLNDNRIVSPAIAKNIISVGATETFNQIAPSQEECLGQSSEEADNTHEVSLKSRQGNVGGRIKPDVVAPGNRIYGPLSAARTGACASPIRDCTEWIAGTDYQIASGTSFAAPVVTGVAALVRGWLDPTGLNPPSPALTRAILNVGAQDLVTYRNAAAGQCCWEHVDPTSGQVGVYCWPGCGQMGPAPNRYQGWGGVSLDRYFRQKDQNYRFIEQGAALTHQASWQTTVTVKDPSRPVRIALAWTDRASTVGKAPDSVLVNDLDLEVIGVADCATYTWKGNVFGSREFSLRNPPSPSDHKNNLERVVIDALGKGNGLPLGLTSLTIRVVGLSIGADGVDPKGTTPRQDFAIAVENAY